MRLTPAQRWNPAAWLLLPLLRGWNRHRNPTRDFPSARVTRLVAAIDSDRDGTLPLGATLDGLAAYGPAQWHEGAIGSRLLFYYRLGAVFRMADDRVASVELLTDPMASGYGASHAFVPGSVELTRSGARWAQFGPASTEADLVSALGKPRHADTLGDARLLEFTAGTLAIDVTVAAATRRVVSLALSRRDDA